jgi:signal transduction histidine kinase
MDRGLAGWVAQHRTAALVPDTRADPRWLATPEGVLTRAALGVPICSGPTLVGVLTLVHGQPGHFDGEDLAFIQAAADQMALAVRNAQNFDERSRMAERQTILYEVLRAVGGHLLPDRVARAAVEAIAQRTGWPYVAIALPDPDGGSWTLHSASRDELRIEQLPLAAGVIGRAHRTGQTQLVDDVKSDPDYVPGLPGVQTELAIPIRSGAGGVLNLEHDVPAAFGPEDVRMAESLAGAVALALDNARLYRDIADKHARLQDLERTRDDLTHALVHDLRNPLTSVAVGLEALELMAGSGLSPVHRQMVSTARAGALRLNALVDSILDVSRLESGSLPLARVRLPLRPAVEDALRLQRPLAAERGLALTADVPDVAVWADDALLARILQNLLGNAVKFTPSGGSVHVGAEPEAGLPPMVRIWVQDTGPGLPATLGDRLFQKFATGGQKGQGSGLGLAFCRLAVLAHGGRIRAESPPGGGTCFSFTLPLPGESAPPSPER